MDYEFAVSEEEAIGFDLPRGSDDFRHFLCLQLRKVVDELPRVGWVWYDESEGEVVRSNYFSSEIMPFNHLHVLDGLLTDAKVKREADCFKVQELRA